MRQILLLSLVMATALFAVDYDAEIQPIWDNSCALCHGSSGGLDLSDGVSYDNLVDVVSQGYAPNLRVASGDLTNSVLYGKITNSGQFGQQMPTSGSLTPTEIALIAEWITELGAAQEMTIAEARALEDGEIVTINGIVTSPNFQTTGASSGYHIQDATGAIVLYTGGFDTGFTEGDDVTVTGELYTYNGLLEITPASPVDVVINSNGNALPDFADLTIAELLADAETYEAMLVRIDSVSISDGSWPSPGSSANLDITDPSGTTMTMRIDDDTNVDESEQPLGLFVLQGVVGQYDYSDPYDSGYQMFPRYASDIQMIGDPTPAITGIIQTPASPDPSDDVTVTANIIDNVSVASASLDYSVNGGEMEAIPMTNDGDLYTGTIPAQPADAVVQYYITATDDVGGISTSATFSYVVFSGSVTAIASIQDGTIPVGTSVTVQGFVTGEPWAWMDPDDLPYEAADLDYYYIQDAEAILSGIKVYDPGRVLAEGDEVRLTGVVDEYYDMTEIVDVDTIEVLSNGNEIMPLVATLDANWEDFEGCLIEVQDVTVSAEANDYGEWEVTDGTNSLMIGGDAAYYFYPKMDQEIGSIVGILDFSYGAFKLQPRLANDVVTADGLTRIQAVQQIRYSDLLPRTNATGGTWFADSSYMFDDTVTVQGIVTMPTGLSYAGAGIKFIYQDFNGGPWSAIMSYDPDSSAFPILFIGDTIEATGYIFEYNTGPSNMTELFITQDIEIIGFVEDIDNPGVPEVKTVDTGDLRWPTEAEQWGNVTVSVENVTVYENPAQHSSDLFSVSDGSGLVIIDDDSDSLQNFIVPPPGTEYDKITGWVYHHYGAYEDSSAYKIEPLYESDMVVATAVDRIQIPEGYALSNYPNPFNPSTTISFRIPEAQDVKLIIYNERGQFVRTLLSRSLHSGNHEVVWQGLDQKGRPVASGLYFYRLVAGDQYIVGKMTYLK